MDAFFDLRQSFRLQCLNNFARKFNRCVHGARGNYVVIMYNWSVLVCAAKAITLEAWVASVFLTVKDAELAEKAWCGANRAAQLTGSVMGF